MYDNLFNPVGKGRILMEITTMTFNIHHGRGLDGRLSLRRILKQIDSAQRPDIIALNEIDVQFGKRSNFVDQVQYLAQALNMNHYFGPAIHSKTGAYGNAILSKYPFASKQTILFEKKSGSEQRSFIEAMITLPKDLALKVIVTHLGLGKDEQLQQVEKLLGRVETDVQEQIPVLLMGDLNFTSNQPMHKRLATVLDDAFEKRYPAKKGATFPSVFPLKRIDYIFISPSITPNEIKVVTESRFASDHLPVWANLTLPN